MCSSFPARGAPLVAKNCRRRQVDSSKSTPFQLRSAFTLIEVLVVIGIIVILMSLLLPAIIIVQEKASKLQCAANLRALASAMQEHEATQEFLPHGGWKYLNAPTYYDQFGQIGPGTLSDGSPNPQAQVGLKGRQFAGWGFQILPYLEQQSLSKAGGPAAISTAVAQFFCPSRDGVRVLPLQTINYPNNPAQGQYAIAGELRHAATDYASAYVDLVDPTERPFNDEYLLPDISAESTGAVIRLRLIPGEYPPRGAAPFVNSTSGGIPDGASLTILLAEKRMNAQLLGQYQHDDDQGFTAGWDVDVNRNAKDRPEQDYFQDKLTGTPADVLRQLRPMLTQFGSAHSDSMNAAFADGSVRPISYSIDRTVFQRLGARADGQPIGADQF
jgi:prepilin-type N-terminal cleavage/methylation domain-containing protein/prepilin-type processing-associated H-X9-DG protein